MGIWIENSSEIHLRIRGHWAWEYRRWFRMSYGRRSVVGWSVSRIVGWSVSVFVGLFVTAFLFKVHPSVTRFFIDAKVAKIVWLEWICFRRKKEYFSVLIGDWNLVGPSVGRSVSRLVRRLVRRSVRRSVGLSQLCWRAFHCITAQLGPRLCLIFHRHFHHLSFFHRRFLSFSPQRFNFSPLRISLYNLK